MHRWREALDGFGNAQKTWSELREVKALAPEDVNQPERMAKAMARCRTALEGRL
jgi:hypothetical protein